MIVLNKEYLAALEKALKVLSSFVTIFIVSSNISPVVFGTYSIIEIVLFLLCTFAIGGTDLTSNKIVTDYSIRSSLWPIIKYRFFLSFIALIGLLLSQLFINIDLYSLILSAFIILALPFGVSEQIMYSRGEYVNVYKLKVCLCLISIFIKLLFYDVDNVIVILLLCFFLETFFSWILFFIFRFDDLKEKNVIDISVVCNLSLPTLITTLAIILYSKIDQYMIALFMNQIELAKYTIVVKICDSFVFLPTLVTTLYLPKAYKNGLSEVFIKNYFRLVIILAIFSTFSSFVIYYFYVMLNETNSVSYDVFTFYLISIILNFIGATISPLQVYRGNVYGRLFRIIFGLVFNFILNLYLIPKLGILGAVYSTIVSLLFSNIILVMFSKDIFMLKYYFYALITLYKFKIKEIM